MTYQAILFDLDGTLVDTLGDIANSTNRVLARRGFPIHPVEAYSTYLGEGAGVLIMKSLPEGHRDEAIFNECLAEFSADYQENCTLKTYLYPEIGELLDALRQRGVRLAVLSNKPHSMTQRVVAELMPRWEFEVVQGQTPEMPRKPDPAGALDAARRMGLAPADFLYLGDSDTDMQTALAAGMYAVGALWGFRSREVILAGGAQALVDTPLQVLDLL